MENDTTKKSTPVQQDASLWEHSLGSVIDGVILTALLPIVLGSVSRKRELTSRQPRLVPLLILNRVLYRV